MLGTTEFEGTLVVRQGHLMFVAAFGYCTNIPTIVNAIDALKLVYCVYPCHQLEPNALGPLVPSLPEGALVVEVEWRALAGAPVCLTAVCPGFFLARYRKRGIHFLCSTQDLPSFYFGMHSVKSIEA